MDRLPPGVSFTIISDSCHSGGLIDKEKEQIGPSTATDQTAHHHHHHHRPKAIPFEEILQHVSSLSGIESEHIGDHLLHLFGHNSSAKFHGPVLRGAEKKPTDSDNGILLSGCQKNETSADMTPDEDEDDGKAYGAFSNSVQMVLRENKGRISNKELVLRARELLREQGYDQHPCLYCSDENVNAPFLWQPV